MNITALTVARDRIDLRIPGVRSRCLHGRIFNSAADVQRAWFDAVDLVETTHFFFIDDDDSLPEDHLEVLERCLSSGAGIAFTDELVNGERRARAAYSQEAHLKNPCLAHHLVLCDTALARSVIRDLPRGHYWPEMMLFWEMAKRGGAAHVPEVGYLWNKRDQGLHKAWFTVLGMSNSVSWCAQNP